jgi:VWFA-related protein
MTDDCADDLPSNARTTPVRLRPALALVLLGAVFFHPPLLAQTITVPGETIDVSIVNLDVVVTDRKGHRVFGLTKDAFEVLEDGKPQPITNFTEYRHAESPLDVRDASTTPAAPGQISPIPPKRQPRVIVVFVDRLKLPHYKADPVFAGLKKLLKDAVQPGDAVLIASWNFRLTTRVNFTDDLSEIDRGLDAIAKESIGAKFDAATDARIRQAEVQQFLAEASEFGHRSSAPAADQETLLFDARSAAEVALYEMREKITAIKAAVTSISGLEGKKLMILVSERLGEYAGAESFYANAPTMTAIDRNRYSTRTLVSDLITTANAAGVTMYPIYPEGAGWTFWSDASVSGADLLQSSYGQDSTGGDGSRLNQTGTSPRTTDYDVLMNEMASLKAIAAQTGGIAAAGPVDISKMLPTIGEDLGSYYSLAYRVPSNRRGQEHKIVVRPRNAAYLVRSRRQFIEKSDDASMRDRVVANLLRVSGGSAISVTVSAGAIVQTKKHVYSVPITVKVPKSSLTMVPAAGGNRGAFTVYLAPGRVLGYAPGVWTQKVPFTAKSELREGYFTYEFDLVTDLLTNRLSVGVIDDLSHDTGFAQIDLPTAKAN